MKVSELTGDALAIWVGRAQGWEFSDDVERIGARIGAALKKSPPIMYHDCHGDLHVVGTNYDSEVHWAPHVHWEQGGPIIESENIVLVPTNGGDKEEPIFWSAMHNGPNRAFSHYIDEPLPFRRYSDDPAAGDGDTPLIAAMRAFVASKYGEEVPDEVIA